MSNISNGNRAFSYLSPYPPKFEQVYEVVKVPYITEICPIRPRVIEWRGMLREVIHLNILREKLVEEYKKQRRLAADAFK